MDNLNSPLDHSRQQESTSKVNWEGSQEILIRILSLAGSLAGVFLIAHALLSLSQGLDLLLLITGSVVLICSGLTFLVRRIPGSTRAQVLAFIFLALIQILFVRFGWSGQSLIPWLVYVIVVSTTLEARFSRIWAGVSAAFLMVWFLLTSAGQVSRVIVITQSSVLMDAILVLVTAILVMILIGILKRSLNFAILELGRVQQAGIQELANAQARAGELEVRLSENEKADSIIRFLHGILDPSHLLQKGADLLKETYDLYYVGVFLIDPAHEYAVLRYGTGEEGRRMVANRHRLAVGGYSMIGWTTQTHRSRVALDVGEEAVHFDNPNLPETRSELSLPLQTKNGILGALSIQSSKPNAFSQDQIDLLQRLADSMAVALEKANSFDRTRSTLEEIQILNRAFVQQAWGERLGAAGRLEVAYENPKGASGTGEPSTVKVPLTLRNEVIGYINLDIEGDQLQADQMEFMQAISSQITSALENARLLEETQRSAAQEQKLNQISAQFSRAQTIDEILRTAVAEFGRLPSVAEASISLIPPDEFVTNQQPGFESEVNS